MRIRLNRWDGLRRGLCAMLASCMLLGFGGIAEDAVPELLEPVGVELDTAQAYIGKISETVLYHGAVAPYVEEMYFPVEGVIDEMNAVVGQHVSAGELLVTLDNEAQEEQIAALERQIEKLELECSYALQLADLDRAMLELELQELLSRSPEDQDAIALKRLDMEQLETDLALEEELRMLKLSGVREELENLKAKVVESTIVAPFDGTVMFCADVSRGSYVGAYSPILYLADDTRLSISSGYVSEAYLTSARNYYALVGDKRYEITQVPLDMDEYMSSVLAGETIRSEFTFNEPDDGLKVGMYAAVCLENKVVEDALLVPRNAVYNDANGRYVYVIEDGERIRKNVRLGTVTDWLAQIVEGLEEGEVVYVKE